MIHNNNSSVQSAYSDVPVLHRAGWLLTDPHTLVPNGYVLVRNGRILETGSGAYRGEGDVMDHGPGLLMASPVNAHTHLELGALKGRIPYEQGFTRWVGELLRIRAEESEANLVKGVRDGICELMDSGCSAVGEISTLGLSQDLFSESSLSGVWFREFLGGDMASLGVLEKNRDNQALSFAGHAPHTTSPDLLRTLKGKTAAAGFAFSIHVAESQEEDEFITTGRGMWADFLRSRGIDFSCWGLPAESVVKHLDKVGVLDANTLAVHLINASSDDFELLAGKEVKVCLCIRSNLNLHNESPDLRQMLKSGLKPCLGTDSLASVSTLNIFDEMAAVSKHYPFVKPVEIIEMATIRGAEALGFGSVIGTIAPGKKDLIVYIPTDLTDSDAVLGMVVNGSVEASLV